MTESCLACLRTTTCEIYLRKMSKRKNMRREVWRQSSTFDNAINHEKIIVNYESLIY